MVVWNPAMLTPNRCELSSRASVLHGVVSVLAIVWEWPFDSRSGTRVSAHLTSSRVVSQG